MKYLPASISVAAYVVTTGLGAAIIPFSFGQDQANAYFAKLIFPVAGMTSLGSLTYWFLLLSFVVIVPLGAAIGCRLVDSRNIKWPDVPLWIPASFAAIMAAYCIYRLTLAGGLLAPELWNRSVCYQEKIIRRIELQTLLGTTFYGFVYSSLPVLGCYFLAAAIIRRSNAALVCFVTLSVVLLWLQLATMHKTPAPLYLGAIWLTLVLCRFGLIHSTIAAAIPAAALFICLSLTQFCEQQIKPWEISPTPAKLETVGSTALKPNASSPEPMVVNIARTNIMRMAVGFPYYVETFSHPVRRCGIDRSFLRRVFGEADCFPPQIVFFELFPEVTYVTGLQPAPVNVFGYAEGGPWYAIIATAICGIILGALGSLARNRAPISIAVTVAACMFAYYVAQTSLTGSLFDSYGLVWLLLPITVTVIGAARLIPNRTNKCRNASGADDSNLRSSNSAG